MRSGSRLAALLGVAAIVGQGCSSSGTTAASDSGDDATASLEGGGDVVSGMDGGAPQTCDASLPVGGDAGGDCTRCTAANCVAELSACGSDCACGPIEACLQQNDLNYTACPGAVAAISSGAAALMALAGCTASHCCSQCFPHNQCPSGDAGGDSG